MEKVNLAKKAIALSHQILKLIESRDLDEVAKLESERDKLIKQYFVQPVDKIDKSLILELKNLNDKIVFRLDEMQQQTRSQQIKLNQSQKVSKAYLENV